MQELFLLYLESVVFRLSIKETGCVDCATPTKHVRLINYTPAVIFHFLVSFCGQTVCPQTVGGLHLESTEDTSFKVL
jgi:hypothetical protein